jgi:lysophospholipase L1-like esterase
MVRIKALLKNIFLLFLGCLVALAFLEIALRVYNPLEIRFKPDRIVLPVNKRYVIDNSGNFTKLDKTTIHTKNALGFRGDPPPANLAAYLSIITVGGSTTECLYLSDGKTWTDILGRNLAKGFKQVWINNAGLDGATTYRHLILLEDYVVRLHPKLVLFLVGINDVGHGDIQAEDQKKSGISRAVRRVLYRSEAYSLGQNLYRYVIAQKRGLKHTEIDLKAAGALQIPEAVVEDTLLTHRETYLPFYGDRLVKLVTICKRNGIEPVFITQPTLYGQGVDPSTGVDLEQVKLGENLNGKLMYEIVELYNGVTRQVAKTEHILLIDLAQEMPKDSRYYYDYLHYTNDGAAKVAEIIGNRLTPFLAVRYEQFKK